MAKNKERIDQLLVARGLTESRSMAQRLVMAGRVRAAGELVHKPSAKVPADVVLEVEGSPRFVSRGGEKLESALEAFQIDVSKSVCADIGASTGGFTDCLLQRGARRVYAIDVGKGQLHWKLRQDERVVTLESTNARYLERLPESVSLITIDVSFISIKLLLGQATKWLDSEGQLVVLVKPQFEAGRDQIKKGGVVRDPSIHREVLLSSLKSAEQFGLFAHGLIRSPIRGPKGNQEFLLWLRSMEDDTAPTEFVDSLFRDDSNGEV